MLLAPVGIGAGSQGHPFHDRGLMPFSERGLMEFWLLKMVARDGIEPPTPAFSGPRSTTELPGLGNRREIRWGRQARPSAVRFDFTCL